MNEQRNINRLFHVLDRMGGVYTASDLIERVNRGDMQCFVDGDTIGITEVTQFPQRRVVDILCVVGDLLPALGIHDQIIEFAKQQKATLIRAQARPGWRKWSEPLGWKQINIVYYKDL